MKHASNKPAPVDLADLTIVAGEHAEAVRGILDGSLGWTVRCVPRRRTVMCSSAGRTLYAKLHRRQRSAAAAEWRWLHLLPLLGISAAHPVVWIARRGRSVLVTEALAGRSLDAWCVDAAREGWLTTWFEYVCEQVAPVVRRLHGQRLVHRDLNLAHMFAADPRSQRAPALIDVERMFRPKWRWRRWVIKDLASLLASSPVPVPDRIAMRFLQNYLDGSWPRRRRAWLREIRSKAERISGRQPRFG